MSYQGHTDRGRRRGGEVGWMKGRVSRGLRGGLEGQVKVLGGWSSVDKVEWRM